MSKEIEKKNLSTCLSCSLSLYCVSHLVNAKLGSHASQAMGKIGTNFVPGLSRKNGDRLIKISNRETIFLATTLNYIPEILSKLANCTTL